jgi:hypothetical protein
MSGRQKIVFSSLYFLMAIIINFYAAMIYTYWKDLFNYLVSWCVWIFNLAQQLGQQLGQQFGQFWNYLRWGGWCIEEYMTLELTIPQIRVANPDIFSEELIAFRPLLTPDGYERIFHPEIRNLAQRFPNLRELRIRMCGIKEVPQLPNRWLTRLLIEDNPITHLPENLPDTIVELFIFRNDIRELPKRLPKKLRKLDVYGNPNLRLPRDYRFPNGLEELICHNCQLLELPDVLPHTLKRLICDTNRLQELPKELPNDINQLTCCRNDIARLPRLPDNLIELRCVDNPRIKWLPELPSSFRNLGVDFGIYKAYSGIIPREPFQRIHKGCMIQEQTREKMNVVSRQLNRTADLMPEFHAARNQIMLNPRRITRLISTGEMDITEPGWDD